MRINENTCVSTEKVVLVPYNAHHVPKYHEWMKDPQIQEATASEPLTLAEEYAMQRSWRSDGDKLTFIICRPFHRRHNKQHNDLADHGIVASGGNTRLEDELDAMVGDVNLFISAVEVEEVRPDDINEIHIHSDPHADSSATSTDTSRPNSSIAIGELELMIAESACRRKGLGKAALLTFLEYIVRHESQILEEFHRGRRTAPIGGPAPGPAQRETNDAFKGGPKFGYFTVKIASSNRGSIALFEALGFTKTSEQESYFGEFELRLSRERLVREHGTEIQRTHGEAMYECSCGECLRPEEPAP
ncbi:N-acetyltransferase [Cladophialophora carrionii]|uniref:N-acetyltransferase n=1 Tax=Cladophialophora carrionii TaxID=86049 RepID=A0A1C1D0U1_9EURO|nr:N-acetyltransferase [Cladophialophora carrionii]